MRQTNTKEKILQISIEKISKKGYDNVSIRSIARDVGIKESSIYNHYKNKEDILDKILKKFLDILEETSLESSDLKKNLDNIEQLYHYGSELFKKQLNNMEIIKIWRIINIEKYHNEKVRKFYKKHIISNPLKFWTNIFKTLLENEDMDEMEPYKLAEEFYYYALVRFDLIVIDSTYMSEDKLQEQLDYLFKQIEDYALKIFKNMDSAINEKHNI